MNKIYAFFIGVAEFRTDYTTNFKDAEAAHAYEWGREIAHRVTLRHFENN